MAQTKNLKHVFLAFAGAGPIAIRFSTFALFDLFGIGGILAYLHHNNKASEYMTFINRLAALGLGGMVVIITARLLKLPVISSPGVALIFFSFFGSFLYMSLVHNMAIGYKSNKWLLENPFLIHMGKISFGIYIYYNFVKELLPEYLGKVGLSMPGIFIIDFIILSLVTVGISTLSWKLVEKPFLKLKDRL